MKTVPFTKSLRKNKPCISKWDDFKFTCRLYIEHYWPLAFLKPLLKLYDKLNVKYFRKRKVVLKLKEYDYEKLLSLSSKVMKSLTGSAGFTPPPAMLKSLQHAADELKETVGRWESRQATNKKAVNYFKLFQHKLRLVLRMFF